jgi:hypothetical protein
MPSQPDSPAMPASSDDIQDALFSLRDSLMHLKMSLLDLAASTDPDMQQMAQDATNNLLSKLRG